MRTLLIAAAIALVAMPCYAQGMGMGGGKKGGHKHDQTTAEKKKPDDKGYKASLSRIPDQQYDPWRGVR